jgi:hypothetical protein
MIAVQSHFLNLLSCGGDLAADRSGKAAAAAAAFARVVFFCIVRRHAAVLPPVDRAKKFADLIVSYYIFTF